MAELYPVFLKLEGLPVLVVGAGSVASRKIAGLLKAGADVFVIAREVSGEVAALEQSGRISLEQREYRNGDCEGASLVVAATNDRALNARIHAEARTLGIPVNAVDEPENCTFYLPAIARFGDVLVAISTQGKAPALASLLREYVEDAMPEGLDALLEEIAAERARLIESEPDINARAEKLKAYARSKWQQLTQDP